MRIGCDIDDCLLNTATILIDELYNVTGKYIDKENVRTFSLEDNLGVDSSIVEEVVDRVLSSVVLEPLPKVVDVLNLLDYTVYFISNRHKILMSPTAYNIMNIGLDIDYTITLMRDNSNKVPDKALFINDLKLPVFIEDNPNVILDVYEKCSCDILVMDQPWNRHIAENNKIRIVKNWIEIREFFLGSK